ncbi:VOC family protein [Halalkalirubrum salinum]|uniref:VOC family protein n=1 Tax=Halalkalirubrum salinum TaxID=2563889 RepID=UPI0010FACF6B|nr:VOC family protein [Halalkalirubrum salinum]
MAIARLDHFVLTVADIDRTLEFYDRFAGITPITFGDGRHGLLIGDQKINLHEAGENITPRAAEPSVGGGDFCLVTSTPVSELKADLEADGIAIELGPIDRTGARSDLRSIYLRDPDGNLLELANEG